MKPSRSEFLDIRGLRYHVRHWGDPQAPKIFMVHGWMDISASFQFMVDCLQKEWHVIAPDWRGFGLTERPQADTYWYPDYLADLDALLLHYAPDEAVNLLGHRLGGNATLEDVMGRLQKTNPRLSRERAAFLAQHWAGQNDDGTWAILGDPAHKNTNPLLYRIDEVTACWAQITAPVLWVEAAETDIWRWFGQNALMRPEIERRIGFLRNVRTEIIPDAGHMLHHDQPALLATVIEAFLNE